MYVECNSIYLRIIQLKSTEEDEKNQSAKFRKFNIKLLKSCFKVSQAAMHLQTYKHIRKHKYTNILLWTPSLKQTIRTHLFTTTGEPYMAYTQHWCALACSDAFFSVLAIGCCLNLFYLMEKILRFCCCQLKTQTKRIKPTKINRIFHATPAPSVCRSPKIQQKGK